jgi:hypothetical protein
MFNANLDNSEVPELLYARLADVVTPLYQSLYYLLRKIRKIRKALETFLMRLQRCRISFYGRGLQTMALRPNLSCCLSFFFW